VAKFYPLFLQDFPTWKSLVEADIKVIEKRLKPVGLSKQRAVRLKNLSIEMLKRNGRLPKNRSELECIPYMGQYIANSVELIIFKRRVPLIDVNMARVLEYYFGKRKKIDIRYDPFLQNLAHKIVNHPKTIEINWAILDLGAVMQKTKDKFKFQDPITTHYNSYC
jgi:A/G-specific adenine glycosylase